MGKNRFCKHIAAVFFIDIFLVYMSFVISVEQVDSEALAVLATQINH